MIPLTIANEVRATLLDYLRTTFHLQDDALAAALFAFLDADLFKGPYVDLRLPFRLAAAGAPLPLDIAPAFTPYVHQVHAFQRLTRRTVTRRCPRSSPRAPDPARPSASCIPCSSIAPRNAAGARASRRSSSIR